MAPLYLPLLVEMPSAKRIKIGGDFYHKHMPYRFEM
jgi:hypothetical protein